MGQPKIRCVFCGAKNREPEHGRCRICGGLLPIDERPLAAAATGDSFKAIVEQEVDAWRAYADGRMSAAGKSRRPPDLPPLPAVLGGDDATTVPGFGVADGDDDDGDDTSRRRRRLFFR